MPEQTGTDPDERAAQVAPVLVPGFEHRPGHHCGSTALRNLLCFHGAQLSEELAFGLGAGPCFYFVPMEGSSPSRFINGRTRQLEEEFVRLTGAPLELETFPGPDASWEAARAVVDSGAPALLLTDLYYLDHYGTSAHFPGHAVVLAGYDSTHAYVADTAFEGLQRTSLEGLRRARHGEHPVFPLAGHMFTVIGDVERFDFAAAADAAIAAATRRMFEPALGEFEGLPALRRFAAEVGEWPGLLDDWQWAARFAYQVIERRGTGGGNFRGDVRALPRRGGQPRRARGARGGGPLERARGGAARGERGGGAERGALAAHRRRGRRGARRRDEALGASRLVAASTPPTVRNRCIGIARSAAWR
jgi:hypothetical protein